MNRILEYPLLIVLLSVFLMGCKEPKKDANYYYGDLKPIIKENIQFNTLDLDELQITSPHAISSVGFLRIFDDKIYYLDKRTGRLLISNKDGHFLASKLGKGRGPEEISANMIFDYVKIGDTLHYFVCDDHMGFMYDENFEIVYREFIDWQEERPREILLNHAEPHMTGLYLFSTDDFRGVLHNGFLYYEISIEHDDLNPINSEYFYEKARVIAKIDPLTNKVVDILGRRSLVYKKYRHIGQFSWAKFDSNQEDLFYLTFEADPLIYECDSNFVPLKAFGVPGREMNTAYTEFTDFSKARDIFVRDRIECGYYSELIYVKDRNLVLRSYTKGRDSQTDGLQVYKDYVLIADVDVPKGFTVAGYIEPYFYSSAFFDTPADGILNIYRFTLDI